MLGLSVVLAAPVWAGVDEGKTLYEQKCRVWHSVGGKGGPMDDVGAQRDAASLRDYTKDPKSKMPGAKMPKLPLTDQQLDDRVAFMLTLKGAAR